MVGMTSEIRASDKDREQVVTRLRAAVGEGLLTLTEADERMTTAYAARYRHELDQLTSDLPAEPRAEPRRTPVRPSALLIAAWAVMLVLLVVSHGHFFFPLIPLLFLTLRASGGRRRWRPV